MPAEAKRFSRVDRSWVRSQKQTFEMKSVIQCCLGSSVQENTKRLLLKDIQKEIEICSKSLNAYLDKKRRTFPRYFFLSNSALLTLLRQGANNGITAAKPFLSSLFNAVGDLRLEQVKSLNDISAADIFEKSASPGLFKASTHISQKEKSSLNHAVIEYEIADVVSGDGESLTLLKRVSLEKGAEAWLPKLKEAIGETLKRHLTNALNDLNGGGSIEELVVRYPTQLCLIGCIFVWTKEAETAILGKECRDFLLDEKLFFF